MLDITLPRESLSKSLKTVAGVIPTRHTLPVLSCIKLEADGALRLTGTDLDTFLTLETDCSTADTGIVVVNAKALADTLKTLPAKQAVRLWESKGKLNISSGALTASLQTMAAEEYPTGHTATYQGKQAVSGKSLRDILSLTAAFASDEASRPMLNGVLLEVGKVPNASEPSIRAVATNGHKLSMATVSQDVVADKLYQFIVRPSAVEALTSKVVPEVVTLEWDGGKSEHLTTLRAWGHGFCLSTLLIDGPYPHYIQVIPTTGMGKGHNDKTAVVNTAALAGVVSRMLPALKASSSKRVKLDWNGACVVSVKVPDVGEVSEELPAKFTGDPLTIGFNAQYLSQILKHVSSEKTRFTFSTPERAATIAPIMANSEVEQLLVLMPLRLVD